MKYLCWEMFVTFLTAAYFISGVVRQVKDWVPGIFLCYCMVNLFSHLLGGNTKFAMMTIFFTVLGYYLICNGVSLEGVQRIKKGLVIYALLNVASYYLESLRIDSPFTVPGGSYLPTGFMVYPAHFAFLCAVALFFAWEWKKWLCIPLVIGLIWVNEIAVWIGLIVCAMWLIREFKYQWLIYLTLICGAIISVNLGILHKDWHHSLGIRTQFWIPIWKLTWSRAMDGFGIGSYSGLANQIFKQFPPNTWLELHFELLQGFFEGGLIMMGIVVLWLWKLKIKVVGAYYESPFICAFIIAIATSCAHSILHFPDTCWIIVILLACFQIEYFEANKKWDLEDKRT